MDLARFSCHGGDGLLLAAGRGGSKGNTEDPDGQAEQSECAATSSRSIPPIAASAMRGQ